jgi:hypothetical protein
MKIIYKTPICNEIIRAKCEAAKKNRIIKKIILNEKEWQQFKAQAGLFATYHIVLERDSKQYDYYFDGLKIEKETEY